MEVRRWYRRGVGSSSGSGSNFDPFDVAFNNMYLLNAGQIGGLATFDAFSQYKETLGRVFGSEYNFLWNRNTKQLKILRNVRHEEEIAVGVYNFIPESILLRDVYASNWLGSYALAMCKMMLGEGRSECTAGLPGSGGAIQLKGETLKTDTKNDIQMIKESGSASEEGRMPEGAGRG